MGGFPEFDVRHGGTLRHKGLDPDLAGGDHISWGASDRVLAWEDDCWSQALRKGPGRLPFSPGSLAAPALLLGSGPAHEEPQMGQASSGIFQTANDLNDGGLSIDCGGLTPSLQPVEVERHKRKNPSVAPLTGGGTRLNSGSWW